MTGEITPEFNRACLVLILAVGVFSATLLVLPSFRYTDQILARQSLKYLAYASSLVFVYGALDAIRISEGRPADDAFTEEITVALGLSVLVLGLSESGLIASMF